MCEFQCKSGDDKLDELLVKWMKWDKNDTTRNEVIQAVKNQEWDNLRKAMCKRIKFGTAGLRGPMKAGFLYMNDVIVLQTAQGVCSYFLKACTKAQIENGVVLGFDGRYNSKRFAELTAKVFISSNVKVHLFSGTCPTPFVSFATIKYGCVGGIMVTASHNPKEDNGYKVYWGNGSQIISPHDTEILHTIEANLEILEEYWDIEGIRAHNLIHDPLEEVTEDYMAYIRSNLNEDIISTNATMNMLIVYSAMHGVGYPFIDKAFKTSSLRPPIVVPQQRDPDPDFSTVKFPNPEEKECLTLSIELAKAEGAELILVNDPDADRLAVAEFQKDINQWKVFSGNEIGALLGWWLFKEFRRANLGVDVNDIYFIASVVSSKMLQSIAKSEGCRFLETLTGFKWMGNKTHLLNEKGKYPIFAFEEAIGYMCSPRVPDKDGVSAAIQVASMASYLRESENRNLAQQMDWLYNKYGYHVSENSYYICHDPEIIKAIFHRIRNYQGPNIYPNKIGECEIVSVQDLVPNFNYSNADVSSGDTGNLTTVSDIEGTGMDLPYTSGEMIMFKCQNGLSVTIRTSGTEPKIKYYTELVTTVNSKEDQTEVQNSLKRMVKVFVEELLQPEKYNLQS